MLEKILYPTDFSEVAVKALEYIKRLKASGAKEVIVLHVIDDRGLDSVQRFLGESEFKNLKKNKIEETQKMLHGVEKELAGAGLKVRLRVETGMPVREILRIEEEENVSELFITPNDTNEHRIGISIAYTGCHKYVPFEPGF